MSPSTKSSSADGRRGRCAEQLDAVGAQPVARDAVDDDAGRGRATIASRSPSNASAATGGSAAAISASARLHARVERRAPERVPVAVAVVEIRVDEALGERAVRERDEREDALRAAAELEVDRRRGRQASATSSRTSTRRAGTPRASVRSAARAAPGLELPSGQAALGVAEEDERVRLLLPDDLERRERGFLLGNGGFGRRHEPFTIGAARRAASPIGCGEIVTELAQIRGEASPARSRSCSPTALPASSRTSSVSNGTTPTGRSWPRSSMPRSCGRTRTPSRRSPRRSSGSSGVASCARTSNGRSTRQPSARARSPRARRRQGIWRRVPEGSVLARAIVEQGGFDLAGDDPARRCIVCFAVEEGLAAKPPEERAGAALQVARLARRVLAVPPAEIRRGRGRGRRRARRRDDPRDG